MKKWHVISILITIGAFASAAAYCQEASKEGPAEPEKVKVEVSGKIVEKQAPAVSSHLKDVVREAEGRLKKIDGTLKGRNDQKAAVDMVKKGNELYREGKYEEARDNFRQAMKLTSDPDLKKTIKDNLNLVEGKADQQQRTREAAEREKAAAEREKAGAEKEKAAAQEKVATAKAKAEKHVKRQEAPKQKAPMMQAARKQQAPRQAAAQAPRRAGPAVNFTPANVSSAGPSAATPARAYRAATAPAQPAAIKDVGAQVATEARAKYVAVKKAEGEADKAMEEAEAKAKAEAEAKAKAEAEAAQATVYEEPKIAAPAAEAPKPAEAPAAEAAKAEAPAPVAPVAAAPAAAGTGEDVVSRTYREAVALYWDNKYSESKAKFEKVQAASPEYARTSYYLGRIKEKMEK